MNIKKVGEFDYDVKSESSADVVYRVFAGKGDSPPSCECEGFTFNAKCKHVKAVMEQIKLDKEVKKMNEQKQLPEKEQPIEVENGAENGTMTAIVPIEIKQLEELTAEQMVKRLEARMDYLDKTRTILLRKLNNPKLWINYSGAYRLSKAAVNRVMTPLGITSQIMILGREVRKEDGSSDYESVVRLGLAAFPDFFTERSGIVNSNEIFYESQIEADQKYGGKKFGKDSSVEKNLSHNCKQHSITRAFTNALSAMFGMDGITDEELKQAGIDSSKILAPYARGKDKKND